MNIDLEAMSLKELRDLQSKVAKAIASFEDRRKRQAISELEERARELGFSFAELTGMTIKRKRSPAVARYANPANPAETWSGRGRKPRWFSAALAAGRRAEDMAV